MILKLLILLIVSLAFTVQSVYASIELSTRVIKLHSADETYDISAVNFDNDETVEFGLGEWMLLVTKFKNTGGTSETAKFNFYVRSPHGSTYDLTNDILSGVYNRDCKQNACSNIFPIQNDKVYLNPIFRHQIDGREPNGEFLIITNLRDEQSDVIKARSVKKIKIQTQPANRPCPNPSVDKPAIIGCRSSGLNMHEVGYTCSDLNYGCFQCDTNYVWDNQKGMCVIVSIINEVPPNNLCPSSNPVNPSAIGCLSPGLQIINSEIVSTYECSESHLICYRCKSGYKLERERCISVNSNPNDCLLDYSCDYYFVFVPIGWNNQQEFEQKARERAMFFQDISKFKFKRVGFIYVPLDYVSRNCMVPPLESFDEYSKHTAQNHLKIKACADKYAESVGIAYERAIGFGNGFVGGFTFSSLHNTVFTSRGGSTYTETRETLRQIGRLDDDPANVAHELGHTYNLCDEYNYRIYVEQNTKRQSTGGCPNRFPPESPQCPYDIHVTSNFWYGRHSNL